MVCIAALTLCIGLFFCVQSNQRPTLSTVRQETLHSYILIFAILIQIKSRDGVRTFYAAFYLISQVGLVIGFATQLAAIYIGNQILPWLVLMPICIFFAMISVVIGM